MDNIVQNVECRLPALITKSVDASPITGVGYDAPGLVVSIREAGGVIVPLTLTSDNWQEGLGGSYDIVYTPTTLGLLEYWVSYPDAETYIGAVYVALPVAGGGHNLVTVTLSLNNLPKAGVDLWVSLDQRSVNIIAGTLQTNVAGQVQFMLEDGPCYINWRKSGEVDYGQSRQVISGATNVAISALPVSSGVLPPAGCVLTITVDDIRDTFTIPPTVTTYDEIFLRGIIAHQYEHEATIDPVYLMAPTHGEEDFRPLIKGGITHLIAAHIMNLNPGLGNEDIKSEVSKEKRLGMEIDYEPISRARVLNRKIKDMMLEDEGNNLIAPFLRGMTVDSNTTSRPRHMTWGNMDRW